MFRQLARWSQTQNPANPTVEALKVLAFHPMDLTRFLEEVWRGRANASRSPHLSVPTALAGQEGTSSLPLALTTVPDDIYPPSAVPFVIPHIVFGYMVENSRVYEIFARVLREYAVGEGLGIPSRPESQQWLRTTEDLFYRDASPSQIYSITSYIRPDIRATRRNAYWRMFGMDLNHGTEDNRSYPYVKPNAANVEFVTVFEEFLREVWRGIENDNNSSGPNATDDAAIAALAQRLQRMLNVRRLTGNLSREEFLAVATMDWFLLTLLYDSPIVLDLKADATSADERLRKIGERVGLPAHGKTFSYFQLADAMSAILIQVEDGAFSQVGNVPGLYRQPPGPANQVRQDMQTIIDHWSIATGRDMKARKVTVTPRVPPIMVTPAAAAPIGNGKATVSLETTGV